MKKYRIEIRRKTMAVKDFARGFFNVSIEDTWQLKQRGVHHVDAFGFEGSYQGAARCLLQWMVYGQQRKDKNIKLLWILWYSLVIRIPYVARSYAEENCECFGHHFTLFHTKVWPCMGFFI